MGSATETDDDGREGASSRDIAILRAYGADHAEAWVEVWIERDPDFHLVASFDDDDDISIHERRLRGLVSRPDRLRVRRSPWSLSHLERIRDEIMDTAAAARPRSVVHRLGIGRGIVSVTLAPDQEDYAARLHQVHGDALDIVVGSLPFPATGPERRPTRGPRTATPQSPYPELPSYLEASLMHPVSVTSGAHAHAELSLRNTGPADLVLLTTGGVVASVVDPATGEPVGGWSGAQTAPLVRLRLASAGSISVPLLIGTTSYRPELGYCVPPDRGPSRPYWSSRAWVDSPLPLWR